MTKWGIQEIETSDFVYYYENETPGVPTEFGGPWGNPATHLHVEDVEVAYEANLVNAKAKRIGEINQECFGLMQGSDWMAIREAESAVAVPVAWATYRSDMRTESDTCTSAINALTTVNQCRDYVASWPTQP